MQSPPHANVTLTVRLNGSPGSVTTISSPSGTRSDTSLSRLSFVAACSCGGAWKYSGFPSAYASEGRLISLRVRTPHHHLQIVTQLDPLDQLLQLPVAADGDRDRFTTAHGTLGSLLVLKGKGVERVVSDVLMLGYLVHSPSCSCSGMARMT